MFSLGNKSPISMTILKEKKTSVPSAISTPISPSRLAAWHGHFKQAVLTMLPFLATRTTNQRLELNPTPQEAIPWGTMGQEFTGRFTIRTFGCIWAKQTPPVVFRPFFFFGRGGDSSLFWMGEMGSGCNRNKGGAILFLEKANLIFILKVVWIYCQLFCA